jgi:CBS-domain-containing membrane protein
MNTFVSDVMTAKVIWVNQDTPYAAIAAALRQHQLEKARAVTAADLMTSPAATVSPDDTVEQAARLMYQRRIKRLPVVDADNHLVGIVSRADVLAVYERLDYPPGPRRRARRRAAQEGGPRRRRAGNGGCPQAYGERAQGGRAGDGAPTSRATIVV